MQPGNIQRRKGAAIVSNLQKTVSRFVYCISLFVTWHYELLILVSYDSEVLSLFGGMYYNQRFVRR